MFGFGKNKDLIRAEEILRKETGISLDKLPDKRPVEELFAKISAQERLSAEAQVALLYRLVAMNFLAACKLMRDSGNNTPPGDLAWITSLTDKSVDWSEEAPDRVVLERATSELNMNIVRFLDSFGVKRGK